MHFGLPHPVRSMSAIGWEGAAVIYTQLSALIRIPATVNREAGVCMERTAVCARID